MDGDRVPDLLAQHVGGLLVEDGLTGSLPPAPGLDRDIVDRRVGCGPPGELGRDHPAVSRLTEDALGHRPRAGARGHLRRPARRRESGGIDVARVAHHEVGPVRSLERMVEGRVRLDKDAQGQRAGRRREEQDQDET